MASVQNKIKDQDNSLNKLRQSNKQLEATMDGIQQYLRRNCLEITGVPQQPDESPKNIILEIASHIGANIAEEHFQLHIAFQTLVK